LLEGIQHGGVPLSKPLELSEHELYPSLNPSAS
jgi:hypothetical protein